jgi:hypothetical protein
MDFVKKNWGFLGVSCVCFAVAIGIIVYWMQANKTLNEHKSETEKQLEFFDRVKNSNIKLCQDNIAVTANNLRIATDHFQRLQDSLAKKSHIAPVLPATPLEAVRVLKNEIAALQKSFDDADILVAQACSYFTFDNIALQEKLPHKDDLFQIFRQLCIVRELCQLLTRSGITSLDNLLRPLDLMVQEEDIYTYTPVEILATGSPESIQKLLNLINSEAKYLFFIRTIDISAPDHFTDLGTSLAIAQELILSAGRDAGGMGTGRRGGRMDGMDGMGMDGMGMGMGGRRGVRRRPGAAMHPGMEGMGMAGMGMGMDGQGGGLGIPQAPPKRQDCLVFASKQVTLDLRLDLIEFNSLNTAEEN